MDVMLSDNARRFLCRIGFVVLCVIPTLWCAKAVLFPRGHGEWSAQLQQQFGVASQLGRVSTLSPQRTDFFDLLVGAAAYETRVIIDHASLQNQHDGRLLQIAHARGSSAAIWLMLQQMTTALSRSGKSDRPQRIHLETVTFLQPDGTATPNGIWHQLTILVENQGRSCTASFVPGQRPTDNADGESAEPTRVTLQRNIDAHGNHWYLDARGSHLPIGLIQGGLPILRTVNPDAVVVNGLASLVEVNGQWSGEVRGQLAGIDLNHVIARNFGTPISGMATATITSAVIADSQLLEIEGHLYSQSGTIGSDLLDGCVQCLGMQMVQPHGGQDQPFRDLRFGFVIRNHALAIFGHQAGAIALGESSESLLIPQHGQPHPVNNLFALLAWPHQHFFATPLTRNVASLAQKIDLPDASDLRTADDTGQPHSVSR